MAIYELIYPENVIVVVSLTTVTTIRNLSIKLLYATNVTNLLFAFCSGLAMSKQSSIYTNQKTTIMRASGIYLSKHRLTECCKQTPRSGWKLFLTIFCCLSALLWSTTSSAQKPVPPPPTKPGDCKIGCTSNDVRIDSAYLVDPTTGLKLDNTFQCQGTAQVKLALILSTNTPRVGVVVYANVRSFIGETPGVTPIVTPSECFGDSLNKPSNKVVFQTIFGWTCGTPIVLTDVFIGWGTGNTNFCTGSVFQCPGTSSKCFSLPQGEYITIQIPTGQTASQTKCSTSPGGTTASFDLTESDATIKGSQTGVIVRWYSNAAGTTELTGTAKTAFTNTQNPQTVYAKVCNSVSTNVCSGLQSVVLTVNQTPSLTITDPAAVCSPGTVDITAAAVTSGSTLPSGNGVVTSLTYYLDNSNSAGTPITSTVAQTLGAGKYWIKATTNTTPACSDIKAVNVTVKLTPGNPQVTVTPPTCANANGTVTVSSPLDGNGVDYEYSNNGGTSWQDILFFTVAANANYSVTVRNKNGNCISAGAASGAMPAQPSGPSIPAVCVVQPSLCGPSTGKVKFTDLGAGYQYSINGTDWQTCAVFVNVAAGTATHLRVKNSLGCESGDANCNTICTGNPADIQACISAGANIRSTESTLEASELKVKAYPNPFNDRINFVITSPLGGRGSLEVYNTLGQKVKTIYQGTISKGSQNFEFRSPASQASNLIYILRVGNKQLSGKILQLKQ